MYGDEIFENLNIAHVRVVSADIPDGPAGEGFIRALRSKGKGSMLGSQGLVIAPGLTDDDQSQANQNPL